MDRSRPATERFWEKVDRRGPGDCWPWTAYCQPSGHARFGLARGKTVAAYRFSYELVHGAIPAGMSICHSCDNPKCVNPAHLRADSHQANMREKLERGRCTKNTHLYRKTKTHCPSGHPLSGDNLHINKVGARVCRACKRASVARAYRKRREQNG